MRHIITGGSGFTGRVLAKKLIEKGELVVNFDLKNYEDIVLKEKTQFIQGDICSIADIQQIQLQSDDVVYHLAARQFADAVPERIGRNGFLRSM
ncbi:NAD(P)-dependent oxidoreductase [Snodgrassella sp. CFCC 13594]|uniref:NAD-dependent epimerase/dehydratase family protein n=1 Tax=Snodgrassella sp. CFCC 13594 TaxID=1775559 RepID=UPI00083312E7|nr:NAD(P)-dependent oxidoreductase [Snodgrassella sp. CFCC 13594]